MNCTEENRWSFSCVHSFWFVSDPIVTTYVLFWRAIREPFFKKLMCDEAYLLSYTKGFSSLPTPAQVLCRVVKYSRGTCLCIYICVRIVCLSDFCLAFVFAFPADVLIAGIHVAKEYRFFFRNVYVFFFFIIFGLPCCVFCVVVFVLCVCFVLPPPLSSHFQWFRCTCHEHDRLIG